MTLSGTFVAVLPVPGKTPPPTGTTVHPRDPEESQSPTQSTDAQVPPLEGLI